MIPRYSLPEMDKIWSDEARFTHWLEIEVLVCEALAGQGQIPAAALKTIREKARFDTKRILEIEEEVKHDVIAFLTNVAEYVGPDSRFIHLGLTSSDLLDTTLALQMREAGKLILGELRNKVLPAVKKRALEHKDTIMIGRSHGIHAEPVTFGLKLALWYDELNRRAAWLENAVQSVSLGKISGAVGTFAHLDPSVEGYVCEKLGLQPAKVSNQIVQRDVHADYMTALAVLAGSLEKFTVEIRHLQRTEVLEAEEFFSKGQKGSSAMPHKRNPIVCERLSGMARLVRGNCLAALENQALWHERDISHSSVERVILPDSTLLIYYMLKKFGSLVENLLVYPENMKKNLDRLHGLIFSQRVLLALADKGLSREDAYRIVQRNAMRVWKEDVDFLRTLLTDNEVTAVISAAELKELFALEVHTRHVDYIFRRAGLLD
ncbi:MAG: adenylosuccinate lyase [Candidatus Glassbacteria bacterium RIFCSPLOWO2_12_FULL_58_11]|uniref:Adenylosuccinate lyase n=1 Tax=Candidatus Glassbacteria bacterium RIFCSPLOWO2_12_FULL_58_11 TaxID=1817867 RepID=A0A1F5YN10_9BACT|nr:MAG: adenylosuccinate lyase [Candidatus Glassbacteria bacterium RIFCSPLOWO2_12_FULL_58_11]